MATSFRDLRTWQHSMDLAVCVYRHSESFPKHEIYGLSQQMRRAAVSVASNIGRKRPMDTKGISTVSFSRSWLSS